MNGSGRPPSIDSSTPDTADDFVDSIGGYRIDVSDDGIAWAPLVEHTRKTTPEFTYVDAERKTRNYRVFAWHGQYLGLSQNTPEISEFTPGEENPSHVTGLRVTAVSPSQIDISWDKLTETGSSPLKEYEIYGVKFDTSASPPASRLTWLLEERKRKPQILKPPRPRATLIRSGRPVRLGSTGLSQ